MVGRSVLTWAITLSYRVIPKNQRSGLVVQNLPYADLGIRPRSADWLTVLDA